MVSAPDWAGQVHTVQEWLSEPINLSLFVLCGHVTGSYCLGERAPRSAFNNSATQDKRRRFPSTWLHQGISLWCIQPKGGDTFWLVGSQRTNKNINNCLHRQLLNEVSIFGDIGVFASTELLTLEVPVCIYSKFSLMAYIKQTNVYMYNIQIHSSHFHPLYFGEIIKTDFWFNH